MRKKTSGVFCMKKPSEYSDGFIGRFLSYKQKTEKVFFDIYKL